MGVADCDMPFDTTKEELAKLHDLQVTPETRFSALQKIGGSDGIFKVLRSSAENGIFPATCIDREEAFGKNEYAEPDAKSFAELCLEALNDTTMIILCVSAVVSLAIGVIKGDGEWYEGFAILMAVVIVTLVTAINEYKKEQQFQELNKVKGESKTKIRRGGTDQPDADSGKVVVGDVIKLELGDKIPADGVLFKTYASGMQSDESSLTGEAEPVKKTTATPMLYSGCLVSDGMGEMVVTSVGDTSQQGIIRMNLAEREEEQTPLQERLEVVAELIGWVGLAVATASFVVLTISWVAGGNYHWEELQEGSWKGLLDFLIIAVTIVAVAVPEGLPLAVTISLAYSMFKMMEDKNLVRKLHACETMVSPIMWRNIAVQAIFQLIVLALIMANPEGMGFTIGPYESAGYTTMFQSRPHYTIIFNVFVWCQVFNEFNSRRLDNTPGCFAGVMSSKIFMGVIVATVVTQILFVEFGGNYTKTVSLCLGDWVRTVGIASLTVPLGYVVRSQQLFIKDTVVKPDSKED